MGGQSQVKTLTDACGINVIGITLKVRDGPMTFERGGAVVDQARQPTGQAIATLDAESMPARQCELLANIEQERKTAAVAQMRESGLGLICARITGRRRIVD